MLDYYPKRKQVHHWPARTVTAKLPLACDTEAGKLLAKNIIKTSVRPKASEAIISK